MKKIHKAKRRARGMGHGYQGLRDAQDSKTCTWMYQFDNANQDSGASFLLKLRITQLFDRFVKSPARTFCWWVSNVQNKKTIRMYSCHLCTNGSTWSKWETNPMLGSELKLLLGHAARFLADFSIVDSTVPAPWWSKMQCSVFLSWKLQSFNKISRTQQKQTTLFSDPTWPTLYSDPTHANSDNCSTFLGFNSLLPPYPMLGYCNRRFAWCAYGARCSWVYGHKYIRTSCCMFHNETTEGTKVVPDPKKHGSLFFLPPCCAHHNDSDSLGWMTSLCITCYTPKKGEIPSGTNSKNNKQKNRPKTNTKNKTRTQVLP